MTLTVPKAGSDAGRAAQIRVEEPQGGAMIAQFGNQMKAVGEALENDYLAREAQRFQTDLTGDMNNLRLEVSAIGDPDQAETAWRQGAAALRQSYAEGQHEDGRPRVSQKNAEKFGLVFDQLHNANAFSLGKQTLGARQAQREAEYLRYAHTATQVAATADPELRAQTLAAGYDQVDEMVAAGIIDAAEGERRKLGLTQEVDNARAKTMVADDPAGFLATEDGEFAGLPADVQASYRVQAQGNIDRAEAAAQTEAERAAKAQAKVVDDRLQDIVDVFDGGKKSVDVAFLLTEEAKNAPKFAEAMAAWSLFNEMPKLRQMTPAQFDASIAGEKANPAGKKFQTERLAFLEKEKARSEAAWQKDGIAAARDAGLFVPDLPDFDKNNPAAYAKGLAARVARGEELVTEGRTKTAPILDETERAALIKLGSVDTDPATRLEVARALGASLPNQGPNTIIEITGDHVLAHVSGYLAAGGRTDVADLIFQGQADIANGNITMPTQAERVEAGSDVLTSVFSGFGGSARAERSAREATDALYAKKSRVTGEVTEIDTDLYVQSLHEVMGGMGQSGSPEATGGVAEVNGYPILIPVGVRHQDVSNAIDQLAKVDPEDPARWERSDNPDHMEFARTLEEGVRLANEGLDSRPDRPNELLNRQLADASISGEPPMLDGKPLLSSDFRQARLQPIGDDQYRLVYDTALGTREIKDAQGKRYVMSLKKLITVVGQ